MSPTHWIDARKLNTCYGASHILRDVNFHLAPRETLGLMGRNGMGKSTLLKSLMGLVKPRSGEVRIAGQDMTGRAPYEIAQRGIAYVPEETIVELERENAALRVDKERLDWVIKDSYYHFFFKLSSDLEKGRRQIDAARKEAQP